MKFFLTAVLAAMLLVFPAGCGTDAASKTEPGFTEADLFLVTDGRQLRCAVNIEEVIAVFGGGYEYSEAVSCLYEGLDKSFIYDIAEFYTYPANGGDYVNEIYTSSPEVTASRGIRAGSTRDDVTAAYGQPAEDTGNLFIYELAVVIDSHQSATLSFLFDGNDTVTALWLAINRGAVE
ncbi:MAG: hypothetical protein FWH00_01375 [Oscillospiraceae bacterium]|nr:hypothetical protein [Oscillospiraceae bacterium]